MLYFFQEKLIFLPTTLPQNYSYSFSQSFRKRKYCVMELNTLLRQAIKDCS